MPSAGRLAAWWGDFALDLTFPWIVCAELAWALLLAADLAQPFTLALHLLYASPLFAAQAWALYRLALYIRLSDPTPPTEVQPAEELPLQRDGVLYGYEGDHPKPWLRWRGHDD